MRQTSNLFQADKCFSCMHLDYPCIVLSSFRIIYLFNALIFCIPIGIHVDFTVLEAIQIDTL